MQQRDLYLEREKKHCGMIGVFGVFSREDPSGSRKDGSQHPGDLTISSGSVVAQTRHSTPVAPNLRNGGGAGAQTGSVETQTKAARTERHVL